MLHHHHPERAYERYLDGVEQNPLVGLAMIGVFFAGLVFDLSTMAYFRALLNPTKEDYEYHNPNLLLQVPRSPVL